MGIDVGRPPGIRAMREFMKRAAADDSAAKKADAEWIEATAAAYLKKHPPRIPKRQRLFWNEGRKR